MTWLRAGEMTKTVLRRGETPSYPMMDRARVARLLVHQHATKVNMEFELVAPDTCVIEIVDCQPIKDFKSQPKTELTKAR